MNLIPPAASIATPSIPLVQTVLTRANLPLETIALAVCVLDALDSKFALSWRLTCPLTNNPNSQPHNLPARSPAPPHHRDSVHPQRSIRAALVIAVKFFDDPHAPTAHYVAAWGGGVWSCEQLNATERCVMENLGWRILPLCDEDLLADAMVDMQLAARAPRGEGAAYPSPEDESEEMGGRAVLGPGMSITPAETPS